MKKLILKMLAVSLFFVLAGAFVNRVGARFKSDDKALDIIKRARIAIGGDAAIAQVKSLVIKGSTTNSFSLNGAEKTEQGETEIALQLPDRLAKSVKIGTGEGEATVEKEMDIVVTSDNERNSSTDAKDGEFSTDDGKKINVRRVNKDGVDAGDTKVFVLRSADPSAPGAETSGEIREVATPDGTKVIIRSASDGNAEWTTTDDRKIVLDRKISMDHGAMRQNELLRMTLSLLVSAPEGLDVSYTFAGEGDVNGTPVNAVLATFGDSSYKLYFDRYSNLPVAVSFTGGFAPAMIKFRKDGDAPGAGSGKVIFARTAKVADNSEHFIRFSDYRSIGGIQLPYKWTTTVAGKVTETFDVTTYDVNPANIGEQFKGDKVMIRMKKPKGN